MNTITIKAGDWIVAGTVADDVDYGQVRFAADGSLEVAWSWSAQRTPLAVGPDVEVYVAEQTAHAAALDRLSFRLMRTLHEVRALLNREKSGECWCSTRHRHEQQTTMADYKHEQRCDRIRAVMTDLPSSRKDNL